MPLRVSAPSRMRTTLPYAPDRMISWTASRCPGAIITMISSTDSWSCSAAIVCSRIVRPATLMSCLGIVSPTLLPTPPASTTATLFLTVVTSFVEVFATLTGAQVGVAKHLVKNVHHGVGQFTAPQPTPERALLVVFERLLRGGRGNVPPAT